VFRRFSLAAAASLLLGLAANAAVAETCLPASVRGHGTGVGFQGTYYARGRFQGLVVSRLSVEGARVTIRSRSGQTLFSGPVSVGQFIPLSEHWNLTWIGVANSNHMNGICVEPRY